MVRPWCLRSDASVRVSRKTYWAFSAPVLYIFWPLMTQSLPSRTASVFAAAISEPPSGSV